MDTNQNPAQLGQNPVNPTAPAVNNYTVPPVNNSTVPPAPQPNTVPKTDTVKSEKGAKRILLVEDEKSLRDLYQEILLNEGYQIETAIDGEEGYQKMLKGGYDLVLLDIKLPKMDGIQILRKLKNEIPPEKPNRNVVILTNFSQDSFISAATEMGVRGFMIKSDYNPGQLISEVERYLETG